MDSIAFGLTCPDGLEPALYGSIAPAPCIRANASAIWLRHEFSTHTNSTRFIARQVPPVSSLPRRRRGLPGRAEGGTEGGGLATGVVDHRGVHQHPVPLAASHTIPQDLCDQLG